MVFSKLNMTKVESTRSQTFELNNIIYHIIETKFPRSTRLINDRKKQDQITKRSWTGQQFRNSKNVKNS